MDYYLSVATFAALNVILAVGLNLISGFCGQVSLGHAAFYGLGAYAAALCAIAGLPFGLSLLAGGLAAGACGAVVAFAAVRVREDFLAIVTMGVGFLFLGAVRKQSWLGAEMGIANIPSPLDRWGYAARSIGIDVAGYKITAFLLGTAAAGLAGGIYAHLTQLIVPDAFNFIESISILAMVAIGGLGSTLGVVAGAVLLTLMPELFRVVNEYKLLAYGGLLLFVMRVSPGGLAGLVRRLTGWELP